MTTAPETPKLAEQLAAAEQAAVAPRQRATAIETALQAALAAGRFAEAHGLQAELGPAREAYAFADAHAAAFRDAMARLDAERADQDRALAEAQQRHQAKAGRDLDAARADEARYL